MIERIPPFVAGCCLLIYWGAVLDKARRLRRKAGHGANLVPRERTGRWLRVLWMPLVVAWCAQPWLAVAVRSFSRWLAPAAGPFFVAIAWLGAILCVLATAATFTCWREMGKSWRVGIDPEEKTQLVLTGPYRFARHPIYALSSVLMLGTLAAVPTLAMTVTAAIHLFFLQLEARREEKYLVAKHGQSYADYQQRVGRFLPRNFR